MWYKTGTITTENGSAAIVGTQTLWSTQVKSGDMLTVDGQSMYEVAEVVDDTHITLARPYLGASASAQSYSIVPLSSEWGMNTQLAADLAGLIQDYQSRIDDDYKGIKGDKGPSPFNYRGLWQSGASYSSTANGQMDMVSGPDNRLYVCVLSVTSDTAPADDIVHWNLLNAEVLETPPAYHTLSQDANVFSTGTDKDGADVSSSLITASPSTVAAQGLTVTNLLGEYKNIVIPCDTVGAFVNIRTNNITNFPTITGHMYYVTARTSTGAFQDYAKLQYSYGDTPTITPIIAGAIEFSAIVFATKTVPSAFIYTKSNLAEDLTLTGSLVDLTATFGAGNEPTEEWCIANLVYNDNTVSVKNPEIVSTGKNMFNMLSPLNIFGNSCSILEQSESVLKLKRVRTDCATFASRWMRFEIGKTYNVSYSLFKNGIEEYTLAIYIYKDKIFGEVEKAFYPPGGTFVATQTNLLVSFYLWGSVSAADVIEFRNFQITDVSNGTTFTPYKEDRLHLPVTLRRLPNGVHDTINADGTWTQRISTGVTVASGVAVNTTNYPLAKDAGQFRNVFDAGGDEVGIVGTDSTTAAGTLYYELATPVTTSLESGTPYLNAWSGGQISIQGLYSDESTYTTSLTFPDALSEITSCYKIVSGERVDATTTLASDGLTATVDGATSDEVYHVEGRYLNGGNTPVPTEITYPVDRSGVVENVVHQTGQNATQVEDLREQLAIAQLRIDGIEV